MGRGTVATALTVSSRASCLTAEFGDQLVNWRAQGDALDPLRPWRPQLLADVGAVPRARPAARAVDSARLRPRAASACRPRTTRSNGLGRFVDGFADTSGSSACACACTTGASVALLWADARARAGRALCSSTPSTVRCPATAGTSSPRQWRTAVARRARDGFDDDRPWSPARLLPERPGRRGHRGLRPGHPAGDPAAVPQRARGLAGARGRSDLGRRRCPALVRVGRATIPYIRAVVRAMPTPRRWGGPARGRKCAQSAGHWPWFDRQMSSSTVTAF